MGPSAHLKPLARRWIVVPGGTIASSAGSRRSMRPTVSRSAAGFDFVPEADVPPDDLHETSSAPERIMTDQVSSRFFMSRSAERGVPEVPPPCGPYKRGGG